jgi:D-proline reductase (dithiol) PrdB
VVARILEEEGFATVAVMTFKEAAEATRPPRALYVRFPIGLTLGAPGAAAQQRVMVEDALAFLEEATEPGSLRVLPYRWLRVDYERLLAERQGQFRPIVGAEH